MAVSEAIENYLETIYILSQQQSEVHAIDICSYLSYSRPTVSIVLRQMREHGLVTVNEDNHIYLTEEGLRIAIRIFERHELLTNMLTALGVSRETALRDACKIEHDLSDETFEAIKRHMTRYKAPQDSQQ
ncbi:MAG: metal-dependent transcriptional regulator [Clostridia bacterium]|nr:metal-dependent transcriptional regulator [Clostridia bacterium]